MNSSYLGQYKGHELHIVKPVKHKKTVKMTFWERVKSMSLFKSTKEVTTFHDVLEDDQVIFNDGRFFANERTARHIISLFERGLS